MASRPSIAQARFRLRKQLLDRLQRAAKAADRSLNEEVETRLEHSFSKENVQEVMEMMADAAVARAVDGLRDRLVKQLADEQARLREWFVQAQITPPPPNFEQDPESQDTEPKPKRKPTKED